MKGVKSYGGVMTDFFLYMFGEVQPLSGVTHFEITAKPMYEFHDFNMEGIHNKRDLMQQNIRMVFFGNGKALKTLTKIDPYRPSEIVLGYVQWADIYEGVSLQVIRTNLVNYNISYVNATNKDQTDLDLSVVSVKEHLLFSEEEIIVERMAAKLLGQEPNPFMKSFDVTKKVKELLDAKN